jgi:hypothetical protein
MKHDDDKSDGVESAHRESMLHTKSKNVTESMDFEEMESVTWRKVIKEYLLPFNLSINQLIFFLLIASTEKIFSR